ncbi:hypothetical protein PanWU01x14_047250, partial [Parasponia andersonii]
MAWGVDAGWWRGWTMPGGGSAVDLQQLGRERERDEGEREISGEGGERRERE